MEAIPTIVIADEVPEGILVVADPTKTVSPRFVEPIETIESLISKDAWQQRKIASEGTARLLDRAVSQEQEIYDRELSNLTDDLINSRHNRSTDEHN